MAQHTAASAPSLSLGQLVLYFLKLGTIGFGGPAALVGYMRKDLVDDGQRIDEQTYNLSIALAQIMPGPLAAQTAIAIGYFQGGMLGATLVGLAFIVPSFLMVLALSWLYVTFGGLPWMQALFYGIGAVVIAIIAMAAYRLARGTNKRDPLLWGICGVMLVATVWSQAELAALFILAGLVVMYPPGLAWPACRTAADRGGCPRDPGDLGHGDVSAAARIPWPARRASWGRSCCFSPRPGRSSSAAAWPLCRSWSKGWCTSSDG